MNQPGQSARQHLLSIRERLRVARIARWADSARPTERERNSRVGVLAGYGNTSYGDYFIGLGIAKAIEEAGYAPVILGRGSDMRAFARAGIETHTIGDRADGLAEFERVARDLTALVVGGGGLFEDRVEAPLSQSLAAGYALRSKWAARSGLPVAVHGVGLEVQPYPFLSVEKALREMVQGARTVGVRDTKSVGAVERFERQAKLVIDPAVIALSDAQRASVAANGVAAFIPFARRAWPNMSTPTEEAHRRQDIDWQAAAAELSRFERVIVVPFHETDLHYVQRIQEAIRAANRRITVEEASFTPENPIAALDTLHRCGDVVTMRYHGFMASYFAGIRNIHVIGESQKLVVTRKLHEDGLLDQTWSRDQAADHVREAVSTLLADEDRTVGNETSRDSSARTPKA